MYVTTILGRCARLNHRTSWDTVYIQLDAMAHVAKERVDAVNEAYGICGEAVASLAELPIGTDISVFRLDGNDNGRGNNVGNDVARKRLIKNAYMRDFLATRLSVAFHRPSIAYPAPWPPTRRHRPRCMWRHFGITVH